MSFTHHHRVRYVECDMQAIVFNSHYYTWMDVAHTEWLRSLLGPLGTLHALGVDFVVAESSARYLSSATFDDDVDVEVRLTTLGTTSMTTSYTFRVGDRTCVEGSVRHVCVRTDPGDGGWAKTPWPDDVRRVLEPALER